MSSPRVRLFSPRPAGERSGEGSTRGGWARGVGIEKTLLVQEGIKKVQYSKEAVAVEFYWERFLDGGSLSPAPDSPLRTPETKEPTPGLEVSSSQPNAQRKWCAEGYPTQRRLPLARK